MATFESGENVDSKCSYILLQPDTITLCSILPLLLKRAFHGASPFRLLY